MRPWYAFEVEVTRKKAGKRIELRNEGWQCRICKPTCHTKRAFSHLGKGQIFPDKHVALHEPRRMLSSSSQKKLR